MNRFSDISNRFNLRGWQLLAVVTSCGLLTTLVCGCSDGALGGGGTITPSVRVVAAAGDGEGAGVEEVVEVAGYGTLTGRVVLQGNMPSIPSNLPGGDLKDAEVCIRPEIPNETLLVDNATNGIQNVFVFLARKPPGTPAELADPPETSIMFDQKVCTFLPHALVLRAGQEMLILNSDAVIHNTHTKPQSNGEFNQGIGSNEADGIPVVYARPERMPVRVVCDFHPWMLAWHLPLDHPYGAVTTEDGSFTIPDIPAGSHSFTIYHEGRKLIDLPVTITPDQTETVEIPIPGDTLVGQIEPGQLRTVVFSALP